MKICTEGSASSFLRSLVTKTAHAYLNAGQTWSHHRLGSQLFDFSGATLTPLNPDTFRNALTYRFSDTYITLGHNKRFGKLEIRPALNLHVFNTTADFNYLTTNSTIDGQANENQNFTQRYQISIETNFKQGPNMEVGYEMQNNFFAGNVTASRFVQNSPFVRVEIPLLKYFLVEADYRFTNFKNRVQSTSNSFDLLNASITYQKEKSPWQFRLYGTNLTKTSSINRDNFTDFIISNNRYFIQPRYALLAIQYQL